MAERDFMRVKLMGFGILLALALGSCASPVIKDEDIAADEALGAVSGELEQEAYEAQETLQKVEADRQKEQQKLLERQITDPTFNGN
jgi:hypothetical protein